jgi:hypothetical protein
MDYIPKFFQPYELVPRTTYELLKNKPWMIWQLFDPRTLYVGDKIRRRYGKMIANTWYWGGKHQYRGWRGLRCTVGGKRSQHRFGRAQDLVPVEVTLEEIWADIEAGQDFGHITCIEKSSSKRKVSWLHHDERNYKGLLIVYS